jgi:hypothetical protein
VLRITLALLLAGLAPVARPAPPAEPSPSPSAPLEVADAAYRAGDYRGAARRYREVVADLEQRPAPEATAADWTSALVHLARAEATLGNGAAARASMERVLAVEPAAVLDPDLFSPALRREFEQARARVAALPRLRLRIAESRGIAGRAWVQGRPAGDVPAEVLLPAGRYRVGVETVGGVGTVTVDLERDELVTIDAGRAPDLRAAPPQAPPVALDAAAPDTGMRPAAWVATGLAAAAAGVAVWQGIAAAGSYADAKGMLQPDGSLQPGVDPGAYQAAADAYAAERRNAWIAGGSALLLGGAAAVLWVVAPGSPVEPAPGGAAVRF